MSLGQRIKAVLSERNISQVAFARSLGISENYVSLIANDKKSRISDTLAKLIEETYHYSAEWILTGNGDKNVQNDLTAVKRDVLKRINHLSDDEAKATLAFLDSLDEINRRYK